MSDPTNPAHYRRHPSGLECIEMTETMGFCAGNAVKYLWRFRYKGGVEDLRKALWYARRAAGAKPSCVGYYGGPRVAAYSEWLERCGTGALAPESLAIRYLLEGHALSAVQAIEDLIAGLE